MNYFVTGGTGFIGRFLLARLLRREGRWSTCWSASRRSTNSKS